MMIDTLIALLYFCGACIVVTLTILALLGMAVLIKELWAHIKKPIL